MPWDWSDVAGEIESILDDVSGIGHTYSYPINVKRKKDLETYYRVWDSDLGKYATNVWFIGRTGISPIRGGTRAGVPLGHVAINETYTILGWYDFYSTDGTSETVFQELVGDVMDALIVQIALGAASEGVTMTSMNCSAIRIRELGNVLCHNCEILVNVERRQAVAYE